MNNKQSYHPEIIDTVMDAEYEVITEPRGIRSWFAQPRRPSTSLLVADSVRQDRLLALLSKNALQTIGDLSTMENYLNTFAPQNAQLCHAVLEAYTEQAATKIRG